jgi:lipopolysaccharide export LptBFGC system permease protein LptF
MNKDKFLKTALIIAIILLMILVYLSFIDKTRATKNPYYAVYLKTGDMYFGKLSRFPKLNLSDIWFLQASMEEQGGFNLKRYDDAVFGPKDKIEINKDNIVWISKLRDDSQVVNYIQGNVQQTLPENLPELEMEGIEEEN